MSKLIMPNKFYAVVNSPSPDLEAQLRKLGDRIGFRALKVASPEEMKETLGKVKNLAGIIDCGPTATAVASEFQAKYFRLEPGQNTAKAIAWLNAEIERAVPTKLAELIRNSIQTIGPRLVDSSLVAWQPTFDFNLPFSHLITCDSSATHFSAKAVCEVDFNAARANYPALHEKSDSQMIDAFGETCNQVLGVINEGLRTIGFEPLISLPICIELSAAGNISQVDFMPMVRLTDAKRSIAMAVGVMIDKRLQVNWDRLVAQASEGQLEFFRS